VASVFAKSCMEIFYDENKDEVGDGVQIGV